jgi:DNA-binding transcriptional regulator YdaS (Cro superfamily)
MRVGERLREWISVHGLTVTAFALSAGLNKSLVSFALNNSRKISRCNAEAISRATGGEISAEELERQYDETPVAPRVKHDEEAPPASEERASPRELGTARDELRSTVQEIDAVRRKGGLTPNQDAVLLGKRTSALTVLVRQEDRCALEDHPDFEVFLADVLAALERTFEARGVAADGARSDFAAHLEAVEAERLRRAA